MLKYWDDCYRDRYTNPLEESIPIFNVVFAMNVLYIIYQIITKNNLYNNKYRLIHMTGIYQAGQMLTFYMKVILNDFRCSKVPNSFSGHTYFNIYFILSWLYDFSRNINRKTLPLIIYVFLMVTLSFISILITFYGGYHSLKQMFYGGLVGVLFFYLNINTQTNFLYTRFSSSLLIILGITTLMCLTIYNSIHFILWGPLIVWLLCFSCYITKTRKV